MNNKDLFDTQNFSRKEIIDNYDYPWETIANLDKFIEETCNNGENIIGEGTKMSPSVVIQGKVIIGKNCTISDSVLLREGCVIGDNVIIGHSCEIKHSVILDNTAVAHFNYVGDSVVGNNVNVGGGAIIANWRFDEGEIRVKNEEEKFDTGLTKFGAGIGDEVKLGSNCVINPGTIIGKKAWVFPLVSAFGVHKEGSHIK